MASIQRERKFEECRKRSFEAKKRLKTAFFMIIIPFGGLYVGLTLYFFIRALALLAGGGAYFGQIIMNYATGSNEESSLMYTVPHLLMTYLFFVSAFTAITRIFKVKWSNIVLKIVFIASFIYSFISLCTDSLAVGYAILLMAASFYGFWCSDIISRQLKEFRYLSTQEGYPDFIDVLGEPVPIANTRGVYLRQYEELKKHAKKRTDNKTADDKREGCVDISNYLTKSGEGDIPDDAMDELTTNFDADIDELLKKAK